MGLANQSAVDDGSQEYDLSNLANIIQPAAVTTPQQTEVDLTSLPNTVKPYKPPKKLSVQESMSGKYAGNEPLKLEKQFASFVDTLLGVPAAVTNIGTYAGARAFGQTPQQAEQTASKASSYLENPIGQATGITQSPAYQQEGSRQLLNFISENIHKGSQWISNKTGMPVQDVENIANSLSFAAIPEAGKYVGKGIEVASPYLTNAAKTVTDQFQAIRNKPTEVASDYLPNLPTGTGEESVLPKEGLHPALAAVVTKAEKSGLPINQDALERQNEALSLGINLTKGQKLQDPNLISQERNQRGIKEQLVDTFNQQNQQLKTAGENIKTKVGPQETADNYVTNSEHILSKVQDQIAANDKIASDAYKKLDEASGGKLPIDGQSIGHNALSALKESDIEEYVPSTIMSKLKDYSEGKKEMNFNLFENLRTQLANESRKAERAGDGNTVHAISVIRNELENLPLTNESGEIKGLADDARAAFRANRQLESSNPFYGKATRGSLDSGNLIQSTVFGVKNDYFNNVMDIVNKDPEAKQHLAQGAMDYMIAKSTDGSGNLNPLKMAKYINDLDRNKRLDALFGDNADEIRKYARVAKYTKAAPEGSYINYSNTAPASAQMIKQYGPAAAEVLGSQFGIPGGSQAASWVGEKLEARKAKKQAKESTSLESGIVGTKLSDFYNFGKE